MSDFAQNGVICTLQQLNPSHLGPLDEAWLPELCKARPVSLLIPSHAPDLEGAALRHICEELRPARWLRRAVFPLNGVPPAHLPSVRSWLESLLPCEVHVFATDSPHIRPLLSLAAGRPPEALPPGKGLNVWAGIGLLHALQAEGIVALQDADVLSFRRQILARLCFAAADPGLRFAFAKMYYSRVTDRLYGRVSRLFLAPLLQALIQVAGHHPLLDFLQSFRYPLAGECAMSTSLAASLPVWEGWALEIGMLSELFRRVEPDEVCQVDGGSGYDHKHQPAGDALQPMCAQIGSSLLHQLATEGLKVDAAFLESLSRTLHRESTEAVRRSCALARINAIPCDPLAEQATANAFARVLPVTLPSAPHPLPAWEAVARRMPDLPARLLEAAKSSSN